MKTERGIRDAFVVPVDASSWRRHPWLLPAPALARAAVPTGQ